MAAAAAQLRGWWLRAALVVSPASMGFERWSVDGKMAVGCSAAGRPLWLARASTFAHGDGRVRGWSGDCLSGSAAAASVRPRPGPGGPGSSSCFAGRFGPSSEGAALDGLVVLPLRHPPCPCTYASELGLCVRALAAISGADWPGSYGVVGWRREKSLLVCLAPTRRRPRASSFLLGGRRGSSLPTPL